MEKARTEFQKIDTIGPSYKSLAPLNQRKSVKKTGTRLKSKAGWDHLNEATARRH
jgi:hypothetical protein